MVLIPSNYYEGIQTIELEYPWITPDSITWLDRNLTNQMDAVEYGCGGSTIFLARRCRSVITLDNNSKWMEQVREALVKKGIQNVSLHTVNSLKDCHAIVDKHVDVAFIDCCGIPRSDLAEYMQTRADIVVIDNYSESYAADTDRFYDRRTWMVQRYDDPHWTGSGTKIYQRSRALSAVAKMKLF